MAVKNMVIRFPQLNIQLQVKPEFSNGFSNYAGTIVYLDVEKQDILERLNKMKVDRIIGQEKGKWS